MIGIVLVIASANVTNLLLVRGEAERASSTVRAALGAGSWRIARSMLAESLLLASSAGVVGLVGGVRRAARCCWRSRRSSCRASRDRARRALVGVRIARDAGRGRC